VVVVEYRTIAVGRNSKVSTACVQSGKLQQRVVFPLAIDGRPGSVCALTNPGRVPWLLAVIQTLHALMEMVLLGMTTALIQKRLVAIGTRILDSRERDATLVSNHLLRGPHIHTAAHMPEAGVRAPQTTQDVVLLRAKSILERTEYVLAHKECCAGASIGATGCRPRNVSEQCC